jgi:hypothetical protein
MRVDKLVKAAVAALEDIKARDSSSWRRRLTAMFDKSSSRRRFDPSSRLWRATCRRLKHWGARAGVEGEQVGGDTGGSRRGGGAYHAADRQAVTSSWTPGYTAPGGSRAGV